MLTRPRNFCLFFIMIILGLMLAACAGPARPADIAPPLPPATAAQPAAAPQSTPAPAAAAASPLPTAQADFSAVVVAFKISGGMVGFCDSLAVQAGGAYTLDSCKVGNQTGALPQADLEALKNWSKELAGFQFTAEDNPGKPDSVRVELTFNGTGSIQPDDKQKQVLVDWVNGLFIRLRPQPVAPPPTPTPTVVGSAGLCPTVTRPALVIADYSNPGAMILSDPSGQGECNISLNPPPYGRLMAAAGSLYYPVFDSTAETITLWRLSPDGVQSPLAFTAAKAGQFDRFSFALSADGAKIAWALTAVNPGASPPVYRYTLRLANSDGSNPVTLFDQVDNPDKRYVELVRFSPDQATLYYALQPGEVGGPIFVFSGRYDTIYSIAAAGGQGQLLFACPTAENPLCIGDLSPDGGALAYTQPKAGQVIVLNRAGATLATLTAPAADYVGPAIFGPTGKLVLVSAKLTQQDKDKPPLPNPGTISLVEPPYTGQLLTLVSDNTVATLWEWLDETRLAYGAMDEFGNVGTAIVTTDGKVTPISPNYALAVLR